MRLLCFVSLIAVCFAYPADPQTSAEETAPTLDTGKTYPAYVGERDYPLPFKTRIAEPFKIGQTIHAVGVLKSSPRRVDFNFHNGNSDAGEIPLHFSIRFDEGLFSGYLVYNVFVDGNWTDTEQRINNPFKAGQEFDLRVRILEGKFQVFGNRQNLGFFEMRRPIENVDHVSIKGDLTSLSVFHYGGFLADNSTVYSAQAPLTPGKRLDISGLSIGNRFDVGLFRANKEFALQVSIRFDEGAVVRNGMNNFVWGKEEREGKLPLKKGEIFDITLINEEFSIQIFLNGKRFAAWAHRGSPTDFQTMNVEGKVEVHSVSINSAR